MKLKAKYLLELLKKRYKIKKKKKKRREKRIVLRKHNLNLMAMGTVHG
jgi:hypothetical protein